MTDAWNPFNAGQRAPQLGELRLYDRIDPALQTGTYRLETATRVGAVGTGTAGGTPLTAPAGLTGYAETLQTWLDVVGPHTRLEPAAFQKIVPVPGSRDVSPDDLPHVVLRQATLPWERDPRRDPAAAPPSPPWLAVVVLTDAERATCAEVTTGYATAQAAGVPVDPVDPSDPPNLAVVDLLGVPGDLLATVFPRRADLPVLCHGREANPADADLAAGDDDGFFAVVLANRRPPPNTACTAYLLSLDGRWNELDRPAPAPGPVKIVRPEPLPLVPVIAGTGPGLVHAGGWAPPGGVTGPTVTGPAGPRSTLDVNDVAFCVLARWSFGTGAGADFRTLAGALDLGLAGTQPATAERSVPVAATGHVRLAARSRAGDPYLAWYRGPLIARRSPAVTRTVPVGHADELRAPAAGPAGVDVTMAAAFEIGRLLAVGDTAFLVELRRWAAAGFAFSLWFRLDEWVPPLLGRDGILPNLPYTVPGLPLIRAGVPLGPLGVLGPRVPPLTPPVVPGGGLLDPVRDPRPDDVLPALGGFGLDPVTLRGVLDGTFVGSTGPGLPTGRGRDFGDVIGIVAGTLDGIVARVDGVQLEVDRLGDAVSQLDAARTGGLISGWRQANPRGGGGRPGRWP